MSLEDQSGTRSGVLASRRLAIVMVIGVVVAVAGGLLLAALRQAGEPVGQTAANLAGFALLGGGLVIFGIGMGIAVMAPGFRGRAAAWQGVGSHRLVVGCTLFIIVLANVGPLVTMLFVPAQGVCTVTGFLMAGSSVAIAMVGVTYFRFIRPGVVTANDLGFSIRELPRHVGTGLVVGIIALLASAAVQLLLDRLGVRQTQILDFRCIRAFPLEGFLAVLLAGGVAAPIAEELYFRGVVFKTYLKMKDPLTAYVASSLLFALLHLNLPAMLPIFLLGALFCVAYQRTGSIVPSMVGHAVNNSFAFAILYFSESMT